MRLQSATASKNQNTKLGDLKKWTVEEYIEDQKEAERRSKEMLKAIKEVFLERSIKSDYSQ